MEIIKLPAGGISKLAQDFKVSTKTVGMALSGKKNTPIARVLRKAALERGGETYVRVYEDSGGISDVSHTDDKG